MNLSQDVPAAIFLLFLMPAASSAQVYLGDEGFRTTMEVVFDAPPKELAAKKMRSCQVVRLPRVEQIIKGCGGQVLRPMFWLRKLEYLAQVPDTKYEGCVKELESRLPGVHVIRKQSSLQSERRRSNCGPSGMVAVRFKDPKTSDAQAAAIAERYGGFVVDRSQWSGTHVSVAESCEDSFAESIGKDPLVESALVEMSSCWRNK